MFCAWLEQAQITRKEKEDKADRFLLKKWLRLWAKVIKPRSEMILPFVQVSHIERPKKQAAGDFYDMSLLQKHLARWNQITKTEKRRRYGSNIKATVHYRRYSLQIELIVKLLSSHLLLRLLLRRHFFLWVRYVLMKDSIEKSARAVEFLRTKVSLMLPDYVPCRES